MADLTITAANVVSNGTKDTSRVAGGTVARGDCVRLSSNTWIAALSDSAANSAATGIALNDAAVTQPVTVHIDGEISFGAILTIGHTYYVGTTGGKIKPVGDVAGTEYATCLGMARTTSILIFKPMTAAAIAGAAVT